MTSNALWLIFSILLFFSTIPVWAGETIYLKDRPAITQPQQGILKGGISTTKDLPKNFYGTWQVTGTLIDTNNPYSFKEKSSDIWIFEKNKETVTLINPNTGAKASITVNEVVGNKATFTRKQRHLNKIEYEQPIITINGDNFYGTDLLVIEEYRNGKLINRNIVKYEIRGQKIAGPAIKDIFTIE